MAIYRVSAQVISRSAGRAITAAAAYRAGERVRDDRTGLDFDYSRRHGVAHTEILAPSIAPGWIFDRQALWNAVEGAERRRDAQLAREIQLALPCELTHDERIDLVMSFAKANFVERGMVADVSLHAAPWKGDNRNEHAHILLTTRVVSEAGFGPKERAWNDKSLLNDWREKWARDVNRALERAGKSARVDHRTLEAQRDELVARATAARGDGEVEAAIELTAEAIKLDREPAPKLGPVAQVMEAKGLQSERGNRWREVLARNAERLELGKRLAELQNQLDGLHVRLREILRRRREQVAKLWSRAEVAIERLAHSGRRRSGDGPGRAARRAERHDNTNPEHEAKLSHIVTLARARRGRGREDPDRER